MRRCHSRGLIQRGHGDRLDARYGDRGDRSGGQGEDESFLTRRRPGELDRPQAVTVLSSQVASQEGRVGEPALAVLGTASPPMLAERQKLLLHWLPNAEPLDLPGLTHLLHAQDPAAVADGLTSFFARHPIPGTL